MEGGPAPQKNGILIGRSIVKDNSLDVLSAKLEALREVSDERDRRYEDRFTAMDEKTGLALTSSKEAVQKAEIATEKRFDSVNEFRGSLKDQAATLLTRAEAETRFNSLEKDIQGLRESRSEAAGSSRTFMAIIGFAIVLVQIVLRFWK